MSIGFSICGVDRSAVRLHTHLLEMIGTLSVSSGCVILSWEEDLGARVSFEGWDKDVWSGPMPSVRFHVTVPLIQGRISMIMAGR